MTLHTSTAQNKVLKAFYIYEIKIPSQISQIQDESIKEMAIKRLKENNKNYTLFYNKGVSGFASSQLMGNKFIVENENGYYIDNNKKEQISQEKIIDRFFTVKDELKPIEWKISNAETKSILGKKCHKATYSDGKKEITAWYCNDIPFTCGPLGYFGLPGLIMELETNLGVCKAISIEHISIPGFQISPPSKGKTMTRKEFDDLKNKKLKELGVTPGDKKGNMIIIQ